MINEKRFNEAHSLLPEMIIKTKNFMKQELDKYNLDDTQYKYLLSTTITNMLMQFIKTLVPEEHQFVFVETSLSMILKSLSDEKKQHA